MAWVVGNQATPGAMRPWDIWELEKGRTVEQRRRSEGVEALMRIVLASIAALIIWSAINIAQAASNDTGRWCVIDARDNGRHCYFQRHHDCMKAISDGNGLCVPNEKKRGELPEDHSK
jgi:hypothetical protein